MPPIEATEPSPGPETEVETAAAAVVETTETAAVSEGSAPAPEDGKEAPKSLLDVVRDAAQSKEPEASSAPETAKSDEAAGPKDETKVQSGDDDSKLPFGKHPRFKQVLTERDEARREVQGFKDQIKDLEGPAHQYVQIENFLNQNNLAAEEFVELLQVGALIKSDPWAAEQVLIDHLIKVQRVTGSLLPKDVREDIDTGRITEERGRELSTARARAAFAGHRAETSTAELSADRERRSVQEASAANMAAAADWETAKRAKDPDFALKEDLIADRYVALRATKGEPKSAEAAVALLEQAHTDVTAHLKRVMPARPESRGPTPAPSSVETTPVPKSLEETIRLAARGARA